MMWSAVGDALKAYAPVLTACAAWFAAFTAYRGLRKWREEALGKRRAELAEHVLTGFYQVQDIFKGARSPLVLQHEMRPRQGVPDAVATDASYAPFQRLSEHRDFLSDFRARKYAFAAVFGSKKAEPFDEITRIHSEIVSAVDDLIKYKDWNEPTNREYLRSMKRVAFRTSSAGETDEIAARIEAAVKAIESLWV